MRPAATRAPVPHERTTHPRGARASAPARPALTGLARLDRVAHSVCRHRTPMTSTPPDLSRLRIDRSESERPTRGRGPLLIVIGVALLAAIVAVIAWARLSPGTMDVQVAVASAVGGGIVPGGGISASGYVVARTKASVSAKVP